jgi:hypothetical protein
VLQHLSKSLSCKGSDKWKELYKNEKETVTLDEEQKRKDVLAARERLVKETLEREMYTSDS